MDQQVAVQSSTPSNTPTFDTPMTLAWRPEFRAYAFTHPLVVGPSGDLVPHLVSFGKEQKFLFKSQSEAQAWKRMCGSNNSLAWAELRAGGR